MFSWIDPRFTVTGIVPVIFLVVMLGLVAPVRGRRLYEDLRRTRAVDPTALSRYYRRSVLGWSLLMAITAVVLVAERGVDAADLGLTWPHGRMVVLAFGLTIYAVVVFAVGGARARARIRGGKASGRRGAVAALLPHTPGERRLAVVVSLSAGVCEEVMFRGLLIAAGIGILGLHPYVAAGASLVIFAVGHLYQGWLGLISAGLLGFIFTGLYVLSGSLLLPVILHAFIDINALVLVPPEPQPQPTPSPTVPTTLRPATPPE